MSDSEDRQNVQEYRKTATVLAGQAPTGGIIPTLEGDHTYEAGDYICGPGQAGEYWPVKRAIFEATYQPVSLADAPDDTLRAALERYGEHQHEWVPTPTQRHENGAWRDSVEPEEGWDRMGVRRFCPDEQTGECWCGFAAALASPKGDELDVERLARTLEVIWRQKWETEPGRGTVVIFGAYAEDIAREYRALSDAP